MPEPPQFQTVQAAKLSAQISRQLLTTITGGRYKPGDLLPPERDLSSAFQVSRAVVREALTSLGSKGILRVRQGRGTTVNPFEEWNTLDPEVLLLLHGDQIFPQLSQVRRILEPEIAARRQRISRRTNLKNSMPCRTCQKRTPSNNTPRDIAFHLVIAKASQNLVLPILLMSISELLNEVRRRTFQVDGELGKAREWHRRIYEAIERHDSDLARQLMADHMQQVKAGLETYESVQIGQQTSE